MLREIMTVSTSTDDLIRLSEVERIDLLKGYAEQDAIFGSPNPRYKQCKVYCDRYLDIRIQLVGTDGLTDADWDLTIF
ncbi:hypothetical protein D0962_20770 [Leptolyngbyaceae cyanobacterium CCMR0082]|uniref:Uncharacterized protein n=2 Tax=Adonisia turfae TaxID=2950184 RepID=A0A6M0S9K4_9CYAN|nr:hypothetical protein [Adonisia turfae]MDV3349788.1 hypothetical protein [Leptothoe sp. LEGE 181152]NEZ54746.1 hypothetical protein [Adonisia turfae CCMR0081]NEZ65178.1 hypothetical protein [Adonisia turfae CCMR0082]